jgi:hypothetical protein
MTLGRAHDPPSELSRYAASPRESRVMDPSQGPAQQRASEVTCFLSSHEGKTMASKRPPASLLQHHRREQPRVVKSSPTSYWANVHLLEHCGMGIVNTAADPGPVEMDYSSGKFDQMLGKFLDILEQAASQGPEHVVAVFLRHRPKLNLMPILTALWENGICVSSVMVVGRDYLLVLEKISMREQDAVKKHFRAMACFNEPRRRIQAVADKSPPTSDWASVQLLEHCTMCIASGTKPRPAALDDKTARFDQTLGTFLEIVEQAATLGPGHVVCVTFRHRPIINLMPILTALYGHGICVSTVEVEDSLDYLLLLERIDMRDVRQRDPVKQNYHTLAYMHEAFANRQQRKRLRRS